MAEKLKKVIDEESLLRASEREKSSLANFVKALTSGELYSGLLKGAAMAGSPVPQTISKQITPQEQVAAQQATDYPLRQLARVYEPARSAAVGAIMAPSGERLESASKSALATFLNPDEARRLSSELPFQEWEQGSTAALIPRALLSAGEDVATYAGPGIVKAALRQNLLEKTLAKELDKEATQVVRSSKFMPTGWKAEETLKDVYKTQRLKEITAPQAEATLIQQPGVIGQPYQISQTGPSLLQDWANRQSTVRMLYEDLKSQKGELNIPGKKGPIDITKKTAQEAVANLPKPSVSGAATKAIPAAILQNIYKGKPINQATLDKYPELKSGKHIINSPEDVAVAAAFRPKAVEAQKELDVIHDQVIAENPGVKRISGDEAVTAEMRAKSPTSAALKVNRRKIEENRLDYHVSMIKDWARQTFIVPDMASHGPGVIQSFIKKYPEAKIKTYLTKPHPSGYMGVFLDAKASNGVGVEDQLIMGDDGWALKLKTDELYRPFRTMNVNKLNEAEMAEYNRLRKETEKLYLDFFAKKGYSAGSLSELESSIKAAASSSVMPSASSTEAMDIEGLTQARLEGEKAKSLSASINMPLSVSANRNIGTTSKQSVSQQTMNVKGKVSQPQGEGRVTLPPSGENKSILNEQNINPEQREAGFRARSARQLELEQTPAFKKWNNWIQKNRNLVATHPNIKTGGNLDFSTSCPRRVGEGGQGACLYCYVESGRNINCNAKKVVETPYKGEIQKMPKEVVEWHNLNGGYRAFSFGDYRPEKDYEQMSAALADAQEKGLIIKAITKSPELVRDFGNHPALRINLSVDHLPREVSNSFTVEEAEALQAGRPNIKIRTVALNEREALVDLLDDRVDVVTGYHGMTDVDKLMQSVNLQNPGLVNKLGEPAVRGMLSGWKNVDPDKLLKKMAASGQFTPEQVEKARYKLCCQEGRCSKDHTKCGFEAEIENTIAKIRKGERGTALAVGPEVRKFIETVKNSVATDPVLRAIIDSRYDPKPNKITLAEAEAVIKSDYNLAYAMAMDPGKPSALSNTIAIRLIEQAQAKGSWEEAKALVEMTAERNTAAGQAIQALSMYGKLAPEGVTSYASSIVNQAKAKLPEAKIKEFDKAIEGVVDDDARAAIAEKMGIPYIRAKDLESIYNDAIEIQKLPEGREKMVKTALMLKKIAEHLKSTPLSKISMLQTLGQLVNPKTVIRNILGNFAFMTVENAAQTFATGLDIMTSLLTKTRTTGLPNLKNQLYGLYKGGKEGLEEALLGINTRQLNTKFDLPKNGVFHRGVLGGLEKTMAVILQAPDRAFFEAAYIDSIAAQCKLGKTTMVTPEMMEQATLDGLYRTFQDRSLAARTLIGLKRLLNAQKGWGLGDMVIKYPATPGNIWARGFEYSPGGFIKSMYHLGKLIKGYEKTKNQREFVRGFSRAFTGSSLLFGVAAGLATLGIISGKRDPDKDIAATKRVAGLKSYQINLSALKRFIFSGMHPEVAVPEPNDTLISYDWALPISIPMVVGANVVEEGRRKSAKEIPQQGQAIVEGMAEAANAMIDQPMLQGISRMRKAQDIYDWLVQTATDIPASFTPTLSSQLTKLTDNIVRNTDDPNYFKQAYNKVATKIPGLSKTLIPQMNIFGQPMKSYQSDTNNPFNVFLNPAFVNKYKPNPEVKMVLDIYQSTGESGVFPRVAPRSVTVEGKTVKLTPEMQKDYQEYIGNKTGVLFNILVNNPQFMKMPDELKAAKLEKYLTDINTSAKIELFGLYPKKTVQGQRVPYIPKRARTIFNLQ